MKDKRGNEKIARQRFLAAMEQFLTARLSDAGYSIMRHDAQQWEACYSLSRRDTDGTVALFFGPIRDRSDHWELPYETVHEGSVEQGRMSFSKNAQAESSSGIFFHHIAEDLTNKLPIATHHDTNVGAGLISVEEAMRNVL